MNAHIIDAHGVIINTIVTDSLDFMPGLIDANIGGGIGDSVVDGVLVPRPIEAVVLLVPQTVTRRQALQALIRRGHDDDVASALSAIPDPIHRKLAQAEFAASSVFERQRPLVLSIGAALGLDLDDLFIFAATL